MKATTDGEGKMGREKQQGQNSKDMHSEQNSRGALTLGGLRVKVSPTNVTLVTIRFHAFSAEEKK